MVNLDKNFTDEAKVALLELTDALMEYDDFDCAFQEVNCTIIDEDNDIGGVEMNGEIIATYVYGGPRFYVTSIDEDMLYEATTICLEIL